MACEVAYLQRASGLLVIGSGLLLGEELRECKKRLLEAPARIKQCMYAIVDLFAVTASQVSISDLEQSAEQDKRIAALIRPGAIVAVVAPRDSEYDLGKAWEALAKSTGWETMVFRSREEGEAWVRWRVREKFEFDAICAV